MDASVAKLPFTRGFLALAGAVALATAACAPQAAAPTAAPAKPPPTAAPAKPAPTTAPAKPAPTAAPAAKPTEKPAAKPAFDEKAVADFYKGKTIRIVVGFAPGGTSDLYARLIGKALPKYVPGNPSVVVENKPGAGGMLAVNTVYNSEPRDGTVITVFNQALVVQQAIGAKGVQFDATKLNWLASAYEGQAACSARSDTGIASIQDIIGGGKELTVASYGKGSPSHDPPAVMNATLGTRFKIVSGYEGDAAVYQALRNKEVQGWCGSFTTMVRMGREMLEGSNPAARVLILTGDKTPDHPFLKGVPAAETLAKTDEARDLLKSMQVTFAVAQPHALGPDVPKDRVEALRRGYEKSYADPELLEAAAKAQLEVTPKTGEVITRVFGEVLGLPAPTLAKLKEILE